MNVSVRGRHVDVSGPFKTYARRRLFFAIAEFGRDVPEVGVRISDQNGPRGGVDMSCAVAATVAGGPILVRATDADAYAAVDRAADRLRARLVRHLGRRRSRRRAIRRG
jgi:ribosomal subunit interface protein